VGHRLTTAEETRLLRDTVREAHETLKDLRAAIREARTLTTEMVSEFERIHAREIEQLSNHMAAESNRHAAQLNVEVARAKDMIFKQIMAGELIIDPLAGAVRLRFGDWKFDDQQPPPYPNTPPKESNQ